MSDQNQQDIVQSRILQGAEQLFLRYGIRSISMDDVARHLAMSKKTLYQHFENKDELIYQMAQRHISQDCLNWEKLHSAAQPYSALVEMLMVLQMLRKELAEVNPIIVHELKRFFPRAWRAFEDQRDSLFERSIVGNLSRGVAEGVYRTDADAKIVARFRYTVVMMTFDPEVFPPTEFDLVRVHEQLMELFVRGLLTSKGLQAWEKLKADPHVLDTIKFPTAGQA